MVMDLRLAQPVCFASLIREWRIVHRISGSTMPMAATPDFRAHRQWAIGAEKHPGTGG